MSYATVWIAQGERQLSHLINNEVSNQFAMKHRLVEIGVEDFIGGARPKETGWQNMTNLGGDNSDAYKTRQDKHDTILQTAFGGGIFIGARFDVGACPGPGPLRRGRHWQCNARRLSGRTTSNRRQHKLHRGGRRHRRYKLCRRHRCLGQQHDHQFRIDLHDRR